MARLEPSVSVVRKMELPHATGEETPVPGRSVFHAKSAAEKEAGRLGAGAWPLVPWKRVQS